MSGVAEADALIDEVSPLAALCHIAPEQVFTATMQQQVVAMARLGANAPGNLSQDEVRTICRTLLLQVETNER